MPTVGSTITRMLQRILGTAIGALIGVMIASAFPQEPAALILAFAAALFVFLYVGLVQAVAPYAMYLGAVTIILITSSIWDDPGNVPASAWERFENVTLGVIVSTFGYFLFWPVTAKSSLVESMCDKLRRSSVRIDDLLKACENNTTKEIELTPLLHTNLLATQINLLHESELEDQYIRKRRDCILSLMTSIDQIATQTVAIQRGFSLGQMESASEDLKRKIMDGLSVVRDVCDQMICGLKSNKIEKAPNNAPIRQLADEIDELIVSNESPQVIPLAVAIGVLLGSAAGAPEVLAWWAGGTPKDVYDNPLKDTRLWRPVSHLVREVDKKAFLTATKGVLAATAAVILASLTEWQSVGATAMVSTIIVIQPTVGASRAKSLLRISGCIVGSVIGVIGIIILSPNTIDVAWFVLFVGGFSWLAGWIMGGSARTSYAGVQLGLAASIAMVTLAPSDDVMGGLDRVFGIFLGILIALPVVRYFYPVSAARELLDAITEAIRTIASGLNMGLGELSEEQRTRPTKGYRYRVSWLLADAYRFREEARLEQDLTPRDWCPALETISHLQECMLIMMLLIRNRLRHGVRDHLSHMPEFVMLREGLMTRLNEIADYFSDGEPLPPSNISELYERAEELLKDKKEEHSLEMQQQWTIITASLGYYQALVKWIEKLEVAVKNTRETYPPKVLRRRFSRPLLDRKSPVA